MCDQDIRVIQFVEKLPNEYQTTVCTEYEEATASAGKLLAYQSTQDDLFRLKTESHETYWVESLPLIL